MTHNLSPQATLQRVHMTFSAHLALLWEFGYTVDTVLKYLCVPICLSHGSPSEVSGYATADTHET